MKAHTHTALTVPDWPVQRREHEGAPARTRRGAWLYHILAYLTLGISLASGNVDLQQTASSQQATSSAATERVTPSSCASAKAQADVLLVVHTIDVPRADECYQSAAYSNPFLTQTIRVSNSYLI